MARRLRVKVVEVSAVKTAANPYATIKIMKRDRSQPRFVFDDADNLVRNPAAYTTSANDSLSKALDEIEINRAFAKAAAPLLGDHMDNTTDIRKAAAVAVVERFNARVEQIAQRDRVSHATAMQKIAGASYLVSPEDASLWNEYRGAAEVMKAEHVAPAADPEPTVSAAFAELQKRAEELRSRDPKLSEASAFAKAYSDPTNRELVEQDRAFHFAKAAGGVDPNAALVQALVASLGIDENHARGIMLELRAKRPPQSTLTHTTADAA